MYFKSLLKIGKRECPHCLKEFLPKVPRQIYCTEQCQRKAYALKQGQKPRVSKKELIAEAVAKASEQPVKTINDWAREAAECNLDYGNYRALIAAGKTYEELKASAASRSTPAHASNHKWI